MYSCVQIYSCILLNNDRMFTNLNPNQIQMRLKQRTIHSVYALKKNHGRLYRLRVVYIASWSFSDTPIYFYMTPSYILYWHNPPHTAPLFLLLPSTSSIANAWHPIVILRVKSNKQHCQHSRRQPLSSRDPNVLWRFKAKRENRASLRLLFSAIFNAEAFRVVKLHTEH